MRKMKYALFTVAAFMCGVMNVRGCVFGNLDWYTNSTVARLIALWLIEDLFG